MDDDDLDRVMGWWAAANYLTVGQIYLQANPLLREPLRPEHIKPRLLGHWGTSPGLSLLYAHLNRLIRSTGQRRPLRGGTGHGGPAVVANVYLEGTYSEIYPEVARDERGLLRLVRQFSTPGGIPSHVERATSRARSTRAASSATRCPRLRRRLRRPRPARRLRDRRRRGGDRRRSRARGRACGSSTRRATAPCCRSCSSTRTRSRARPCSARAADEDVAELLRGHGLRRRLRRGRRPGAGAPRPSPPRSTRRHDAIREIQADARERRAPAAAPRWPAIVLRTPEGLDRAEGRRRRPGRGHVPRPPGAARRGAREPGAPAILEEWLRSYRPEELFDATGRCARSWPALAPAASRGWARTRTPTAAGCVPLDLPDLGEHAVDVPRPGPCAPSRRGRSARCSVTLYVRQAAGRQLPPLLPRRDQLEPARRRVRGREPLLDAPARATTTCRPTAG